MALPPDDPEQNRLSGRLTRYARVGAGVGGTAARIAGAGCSAVTSPIRAMPPTSPPRSAA